MKRATVSLINVKSCNALLHMLCVLLLCISIYLKSVLRYTFLILDTYHPVILYYVSKDVRARGYFLKPEEAREQQNICETLHRIDAGTVPRLIPSASHKIYTSYGAM